MKESKISNILKQLMFKKNIKTAQLAREINVPQQTMQRIASGISPQPHLSNLTRIAEYFNISIKQLKGIEPIPWLEISSQPGWQEVCLIQWNEPVNWPPKDEKQKMKYNKILTDAKVGANAFALTMKDSSMEPLFPEGTTLIVDPDTEVQDRRYVVVQLKNQPSATFRQLLIDLKNSYLKALSPEFDKFPIIKLSSDDKICGVLVQAKQDYAI